MTAPLTAVEQLLVDRVGTGDMLDLAGDNPVDPVAMRGWGDDRTVRAVVLRDILRGRLAPDPDPRGLQLQGARIDGWLDLGSVRSTVRIMLIDCLLEKGLDLTQAQLTFLALGRCVIESSTGSAISADRLTATSLSIRDSTVTGTGSAGAVRLADARIAGSLNCDGAVLSNDTGPALTADRALIEGGVTLRKGFTATGSGKAGAIRLPLAHIRGQLDCSGAKLRNDTGPALAADGVQIDEDALLLNKFAATGSGPAGAIRLPGARIGGQLDCSGAKMKNGDGPALVADGAQVKQHVFLRDRFTATGFGADGAIRLRGARIGGVLDFRGAKLRNGTGPALLAVRAQADEVFLGGELEAGGGWVVVDLAGMTAPGGLVFDPARLAHRTDPTRRLNLSGFTYAGLPAGVTPGAWLELIRTATPAYAAQPYQHLAAAHRAAGHDADARRVLIAQRRDQLRRRAITSRAERGWVRLTGLTLAYGYQPWRALLLLLAVLAASLTTTLALATHGALAQPTPAATVPTATLPTATTAGTATARNGPPTSTTPTTSPLAPVTPMRPCTVTDRVGIGLDLGTPLIKTGNRSRCDTTPGATGQALTITGWTYQLLAWSLATLFIAGFTNAVRKT